MLRHLHRQEQTRLHTDRQASHMLRYLSSHLENCNIKMSNAYAFMFEVVYNGGVARTPEATLKSIAI